MISRSLKRAALIGLLGLVLPAALAAAPAAAVPTLDGEFPVAGLETNGKLAAGSDENMWVAVSDGANDVARITPAGDVTPFDLGAEGASGIVSDADGNLWITRNGGVTKFSPADPVGTKEPTDIAAVNGNHSIVLGPDGNLWVAATENLVRVPPAAPATAQAFPIAGLSPRDIDVAGSLLAIADFGSSRVVTATTADPPVTTDYLIAGGPQGVAGNPSGQIAFSQPSVEPREVGLLTPPGPSLTTQFPGTDPFGVALGADGAYWFAESNGDRLIRLTPDNQTTTLDGFSAASVPRQIAAGPGNTLWVTLAAAGKVARVSGVDPPSPTPPAAGAAPRTRIAKGPKPRVKTKRKRAAVKFRFDSPDAGAAFQCALVKLKKRKKGKAAPKPSFKPCKSPRSYRLKPGRYRFSVRAVRGGVADPSPAKRTFRIVRVR